MNGLPGQLLVCLLVFFFGNNLYGQDSLALEKLEQIIIKSSKIETSKYELPLAITAIDFLKEQSSKQQLSFNDYLLDVPGLFSLNANNYAQDLRVSIRGFGARAAFGIRGVKIIVDGIPETTPDGQGQIDNLNLGAISNIEVIRGPSSLLYGNASGGIISINTLNKVEKNEVNLGLSSGSYNMNLYQAGFGLKTNKTSYIFQSNHIKTDGFRSFSGFKNTNINGRIFHSFSKTATLNFNINYSDSPYAQDAGSLNAEALKEDRTQARQTNLDFGTEEAVRQLKLGLNYKHKFGKAVTLNSYGFFATRDFLGKLPFEFGGIVEIDRTYFGQGSSVNFKSNKGATKNTVQLGYELAFQKDHRQRFRNLQSSQGDKTLDQDEIFNASGAYLIDHLKIGNLMFRGGIRYDANVLKAEDRFLDNGDNSGAINLNSFNYSLGTNYKFSKRHHVFAGVSSSFETPVLSELSANPSDQGGFNETLEAQKAINYEIGYKLNAKKTEAEVSLFIINTEDDIVPFELAAFPDRDFFRNAGSTIRKGIEVFLKQKLTKGLLTNASYTYSEFEYDDYELPSGNFNGNLLPGIPKHQLSLSSTYTSEKGFFAKLQGLHVGSFYANDANSTRIKPYTVINMRLKHDVTLKKVKLIPFLGVNNLLDTKYNDNIRINAFGGRYFEPAPGINPYLGVRAHL